MLGELSDWREEEIPFPIISRKSAETKLTCSEAEIGNCCEHGHSWAKSQITLAVYNDQGSGDRPTTNPKEWTLMSTNQWVTAAALAAPFWFHMDSSQAAAQPCPGLAFQPGT